MTAKDILLMIIWKKEAKVKMMEAKLMMMKSLMSSNKCLLKKNKVLLETRTKSKRNNLNLTLQLLIHNSMNKPKLTFKNLKIKNNSGKAYQIWFGFSLN